MDKMQEIEQETAQENRKLKVLKPSQIGKSSSTPQSLNSSPSKSDMDPFSEINPRFLTDSSESEEDISEVESFVIDQNTDLDESDTCQASNFLLSQEEETDQPVDPETQARLEALLEAAGIGKISSGDGKQLADPEVLRRLTSSVSCALDEAAAALTRMRTENPRPQPERSLVEACTDGDVGTVRKLLTEGRSVHETTDEGESLLSLACSAGYYELAQVLLAMHANVEDRGIKGDCTPLMEAASSGYVDIVRLLIHHGADVNAQSSSGNTPLMYACAGGHVDAVRVLLDSGANVEEHNENGHTPLMEAASAGHVPVAEILLERGAGINTHSNEFKESALTLACYKGHLDMVRFLLEAGADQEHKTDEMHTALMEASMDGHVEVARLLLDSGAQVNMPTDSFESPLTLAACGGHVDLALLLIERGANIEEVNDEGYTPLMEAAREGHEDMVAILLVKGANINAQTEETQETALTLACCGGFLEVANFLMKNGAEIELGASTPLMEAAQEGHLELVRYLLEVNADVNAQTQTGDTALTYACENGHTDVASLLLQYGADLEHESEGGRTPLMKACRAGHVCTVKFLLSQSAKVNKQTTNNDHTPLSLAAAGGHIAVVDLLLSQSANPFHKLKDNSTMLIEAAKGGHTNVVQLLLDYPHSIMMRSNQAEILDVPETKTPTQEEPKPVPPQPQPQPQAQPIPQGVPVSSEVPAAQTNGTNTGKPNSAVANGATNNLKVFRKARLLSSGDSNHSLTTPEVQQVRNQPPPPLPDAKDDAMVVKPPTLLSIETDLLFQRQKIVEELQSLERVRQEKRQTLSGPPSSTILTPTTPPGPPPDPLTQGDAGDLIQIFCEGMVCASTGVFHSGNANQGLIVHGTTEQHKLPVLPPPTHLPITTPSEVVQATAISDRPKAKPTWKKEGKNLRKSNSFQTAFNQQQQQYFDHVASLTEGVTDPSAITKSSHYYTNQILAQIQQQMDMNYPLRLPIRKDPDTSEEQDQSLQTFNPGQVRVIESLEEMGTLSSGDVERLRLDSSAASAFMAGVEAASKLIGSASNLPFQVVPTDHGEFQVVASPDQAANIQYLYTAVPNAPPPTTPMAPPPASYATPCQEVPVQVDNKTQPVTAPIRTKSEPRPPSTSASAMPVLTPPIISPVPISTPNQIPNLVLKAPPCKTTTGTSRVKVEISPREQVQTGTQTESKKPIPGPLSKEKKKTRFQLPGQQKSTQVPAVQTEPNHNPQSGNLQTGTAYCMDVDSATDSNNDTALTLACAGGHEELVELLLSRGANIEHRDKKGFTPLILAATAGHEKVVESLLNHSADMEAQSERTKDTPLSLACSGGRYEVVELLLSKGANKEHRNVSDYTPLSLAASGGYVNIIKLLLTHGAEINSRTGSKLGISPLMLAAMNGHTAAVKLLLDMGSDINAQIETNRNTALTLACFQGRHEVVSLLLDRRANVEHRAKTGLTPLMEAASGGYNEVGRVLLDKGADVNAPPVPSSRDTALTIAADKGHFRFVELLLNRSAQVEVKNKKGNSPLWLAANGGHLAVVELLYNAGANIDSQDNRKVSCLMAAFRKGHLKVVKWMVNHVTQFPSDQEMTRYISTVNDKELLEKCQDCTKIIRAAKDQQAAKANKNATILLEELFLEKTREESKKAAAAKKRERKKKKKLEKKEEKRKLQEENEKNERFAEDDEEEDQEEEEEVKEPSNESPARGVEGEEGDSGIDANSQGSCSSSEVKTGASRRKEKKKKKSGQQSPTTVSNSTPSTSRRNIVQPPPASPPKEPPKPIKVEPKNSRPQQGKVIKVQQPLVFEPTRHPADREDFEATGSEVYVSGKSKKTNYMTYCEDTLTKPTIATSPKQVGKREEGWKEVGRKSINSPYKSKKVSVPLHAISRVIGRGGSNINAIRTATGALIEVEKQSKGQGERIITLKGSTEATKQAHTLIAALIKDPDVDILQILPKSAKSAAAVWEKSVNTAKSKPTGKTPIQSTSATFVKTPIPLVTSATPLLSLKTTPNAAITSRVTAPRHAAAAAKRQLASVLGTSTNTTMSYTTVVTSARHPSGVKTSNSSNNVGQTFAAKLSMETVNGNLPSNSLAPSATQPVSIMVSTNQVISSSQTPPISSLTVSPSPPQCQMTPTVATPSISISKHIPLASPIASKTPVQSMNMSNEAAASPVTPSKGPSTPPSAATLEYSLFNDNFTKVTQQSMWGRDNESQKGMNFASAAATGAPNTSVVMPPSSIQYLDPSPPQVDISKAPGYRGNSMCSPVSKVTTSSTTATTSVPSTYYPPPSSDSLQNFRPNQPPPNYGQNNGPPTEIDHSYHQPPTNISSRLNPRAPDFSTNYKTHVYSGNQPYVQQIMPNNNIPPYQINKYQVSRTNGQRWPMLHNYQDVSQLANLAMGQNDLLGALENGSSNVSPSSPQSQNLQDDRKVPPRPIGTERAWKNYNTTTIQPEMELPSWIMDSKMNWASGATNILPNRGIDTHQLYRSVPPPAYSRIIQPEDVSHLMDTQYQATIDGSGQYNGGGISMMHMPMIAQPYNVTTTGVIGPDLGGGGEWDQGRLQELPQDKNHYYSASQGWTTKWSH